MSLPGKFLPKLLKRGQKMPQVLVPVPPGFSVSGRFYAPGDHAYVIVGFMFGGTTFLGNPIPSYDILTGMGVRVRFFYQQLPAYANVFDSFQTGWFYLTSDFLDRQISYGPRIITNYFDATIENSLAVGVTLSLTAFEFEPLLKDLEESLKPARYRLVKPE